MFSKFSYFQKYSPRFVDFYTEAWKKTGIYNYLSIKNSLTNFITGVQFFIQDRSIEEKPGISFNLLYLNCLKNVHL